MPKRLKRNEIGAIEYLGVSSNVWVGFFSWEPNQRGIGIKEIFYIVTIPTGDVCPSWDLII